MRLKDNQIERLVRMIFTKLKENDFMEFKQTETKVFARAVERVKLEYQKEEDLVREVNKMLDDLEAKTPGGFDRRKMFGMIKSKLAKEKGIVL